MGKQPHYTEQQKAIFDEIAGFIAEFVPEKEHWKAAMFFQKQFETKYPQFKNREKTGRGYQMQLVDRAHKIILSHEKHGTTTRVQKRIDSLLQDSELHEEQPTIPLN